MKVEQTFSRVFIKSDDGAYNKFSIEITETADGLVVNTGSGPAAVYRGEKQDDRKTFLFTNGQPIEAWKKFKLLM